MKSIKVLYLLLVVGMVLTSCKESVAKESNHQTNILMVMADSVGAVVSDRSDNPILRESDPDFLYAADPSAEVFDGKVYVYCSHDQPDAVNYKSMQDYVILSSSNMVDWVNHGVVFKPREFDWAYGQMNAPDAAYKDGWYYYYFPFYRWKVGVAWLYAGTAILIIATCVIGMGSSMAVH